MPFAQDQAVYWKARSEMVYERHNAIPSRLPSIYWRLFDLSGLPLLRGQLPASLASSKQKDNLPPSYPAARHIPSSDVLDEGKHYAGALSRH